MSPHDPDPSRLGVLLPDILRTLLACDDPSRWPIAPADIHPDELFPLAKYHRLHGVLATTLIGLPPREVQPCLLRAAERTATGLADRFQRRLVEPLENIAEVLARQRIVPTLLKGGSLVLTGLLSPGSRPIHDLDLLVREPEVDRTAKALEQLGYRPGTAPRQRAWARKHHYQDVPWTHPTSGAVVDLHWHLRRPTHRPPFSIEHVERAPLQLPSGHIIHRLSDVEETLHLAQHFLSDRAEGRPGALGQLYDVRVSVHRLVGNPFDDLVDVARARGQLASTSLVLASLDLLMHLDPSVGGRIPEPPCEKWTSAFAVRRVLAPRPDHIQLFMVTPDVDMTWWRRTTRALAYLRRSILSRVSIFAQMRDRARHVSYTLRLMARAIRQSRDTYAEFQLDRWIHNLDR